MSAVPSGAAPSLVDPLEQRQLGPPGRGSAAAPSRDRAPRPSRCARLLETRDLAQRAGRAGIRRQGALGGQRESAPQAGQRSPGRRLRPPQAGHFIFRSPSSSARLRVRGALGLDAELARERVGGVLGRSRCPAARPPRGLAGLEVAAGGARPSGPRPRAAGSEEEATPTRAATGLRARPGMRPSQVEETPAPRATTDARAGGEPSTIQPDPPRRVRREPAAPPADRRKVQVVRRGQADREGSHPPWRHRRHASQHLPRGAVTRGERRLRSSRGPRAHASLSARPARAARAAIASGPARGGSARRRGPRHGGVRASSAALPRADPWVLGVALSTTHPTD